MTSVKLPELYLVTVYRDRIAIYILFLIKE